MENPYGMAALWLQGDWVTRSIAGLLALMSIITWTVLAFKARQFWHVRRYAQRVQTEFWHSRNLEAALQTLQGTANQNPFRALALEGQEASAHHAQASDDLHGALNLSDWLQSCLKRGMEEASARLQSGLSVLASIGSTAPFVGLFGTVWGIYHALVQIGVSGQAGLDKVAGPVGEALIMTACGLGVAIPAVLGYNALTRTHKACMTQLARFAHDLHAYWVTGARVGSSQTTSPTTPATQVQVGHSA